MTAITGMSGHNVLYQNVAKITHNVRTKLCFIYRIYVSYLCPWYLNILN